MKNLFLLPTDKPSKLFIIDKSKMFLSEQPYLSFSRIGSKVHKIEGSDLYQPKHIYITNSEEIKEEDGVILISGRLVKAEVRNGQLGFQSIDSVAFLPFKNDDKKIILTTDQDLIKDGVQAIDDEFLEWFVKNPSCEKVEIKKGFPDGTAYGYNFLGYKIIIPQEKPKQETLEESVERLVPEAGCELNNSEASYWQQGWISGHIDGAKWQAEQLFKDDAIKTLETCMAFLLKKIEGMYSEEEAYKIWKAGQDYWKTSGESKTFEEFVEQFKKKS